MLNKLIPRFKNKQERLEFWHSIYKASLTSKSTKVKFCAQYNISDASLYRWAKYFEKHPYINKSYSKVNSTAATIEQSIRKNQHKPNSIFLPVTVTKVKTKRLMKQSNNHVAITSEGLPSIELFFPNGIKLIFRQKANIDLLMQLITGVY